MAKYNLNDDALAEVKEDISIQISQCNMARTIAIRRGESDLEVKRLTDVQTLYEVLMSTLNVLN